MREHFATTAQTSSKGGRQARAGGSDKRFSLVACVPANNAILSPSRQHAGYSGLLRRNRRWQVSGRLASRARNHANCHPATRPRPAARHPTGRNGGGRRSSVAIGGLVRLSGHVAVCFRLANMSSRPNTSRPLRRDRESNMGYGTDRSINAPAKTHFLRQPRAAWSRSRHSRKLGTLFVPARASLCFFTRRRQIHHNIRKTCNYATLAPRPRGFVTAYGPLESEGLEKRTAARLRCCPAAPTTRRTPVTPRPLPSAGHPGGSSILPARLEICGCAEIQSARQEPVDLRAKPVGGGRSPSTRCGRLTRISLHEQATSPPAFVQGPPDRHLFLRQMSATASRAQHLIFAAFKHVVKHCNRQQLSTRRRRCCVLTPAIRHDSQ